MKAYRNPATIHPPVAAYTHHIEVREPVRWLVLSGQLGRTADGTVPEDAVQQLDVALENVVRNLAAAQMGLDDLVKLTIYIAGDMDVLQRRKVLTSRLQEAKPCMTLLFVAALADPIYKVEIDAWAAQAEDGSHQREI